MKIAVIAFSVHGATLAKRLMTLAEQGDAVDCYIARRHAGKTTFKPFASVYELTGQLFGTVEAIIFIGASGIAVRAIAPFVKSKLTDPAVIVCDETGRFSISLLAGHAGGANRLTGQIASLTGATPVITTASDSHTILNGIEQPDNLVLGIGCRRGLSAENIERTITILLWDKKIPLTRICDVATIDVKRNENGLRGFAKAHKLPLHFFSAAELTKVQGVFLASERVLQTVGVDNVCERAAVLCGGKGKLIMHKMAKDGVTVAVFEKE